MNKKLLYFLVAVTISSFGASFNYIFCDCNKDTTLDFNNKNLSADNLGISLSSVKAVPNSNKKNINKKVSKLPLKNNILKPETSKIREAYKNKINVVNSQKINTNTTEVLKETAVISITKNEKYNFKSKDYVLNFQIGESFTNLKDSHKQKLIEIFKTVKGTDLKVSIVGHTDSFGKSYSNLVLGKKRANYLKSQLLSLGLLNKQVIASSKGESEPIATNNTEVGRLKNRRIEIKIY